MNVDARADIWAMGVILHECIVGRTPFGASDVHGLLRAAIEDPPEPLPAWVPQRVQAIVARCLEKDRRRRYPTAKALRSDLEEALGALSMCGPPSSRTAFARTRSIPPSMPKPRAAKVQLTARLCAAALMALVAVPLAAPGRMTNAAIVYLTAPVRAAMLEASIRAREANAYRAGER
jgi:serine/threonine protein kinase